VFSYDDPSTTNVTVVGASSQIVDIPVLIGYFGAWANYQLIEQLAATIDAGASPTVVAGGSGNLDATTAPTTPSDGGLTEEVVSTSGAFTTSAGTDFLTDYATGAVTITGSPFLNVIAGTGGLTFYGASSGNVTVAVGGGNNLIALSAGSTYDVALPGSGPEVFESTILYGTSDGAFGQDTVFAAGSGTVDAGTGGKGLFFVGQYAGTQNLLEANGAQDTIVAGAGAVTIAGGYTDTIYLGTGSDIVTNAQLLSEIVGGTVAATQTLFGVGDSTVFGNADTIIFIASPGDGPSLASTITGGVRDTIFGADSANLTFTGGSTQTLLVAGAGNETLNGASSSAPEYFIAGTGNATLNLGSGMDTVAVLNGQAGGTDVITGFTSVDTLAISGYGTATPTVTASGGNTVFALSDGTRITLLGYVNGTRAS
jgi:hypothetical protein